MSLQQLKSEEDEAVVSNQEEKDGQCQQVWPVATNLIFLFFISLFNVKVMNLL